MAEKRSKRLVGLLTSQSFVLFAFILIISILVQSSNPKFLSGNNISSILRQSTALGLVACGTTVLIISGSFDISLGSMIGLVTCVMAIMLNNGYSDWTVAAAAIILCVACSLLNGGISLLFNAPPFIVTLATGNVYLGLALLFTKGYLQTIYGKFRFVASTSFFGFLHMQFIIMFLGFALIHFILKWTRTGREVYAIGTNENAAYISGINVRLSKLKFFAISGVMTGIACIVLLSRLSCAQSTTGGGMELEAIGAVVIGGASVNGGKGNVIGSLFGVILLSMISNAINMLQISAYYQDIVYGLIIIIALGITAGRYMMMKRKSN